MSVKICNYLIYAYLIQVDLKKNILMNDFIILHSPPTRYPPEEKLKNPSWGPSELETRISWLSKMTFGKIIPKHIFKKINSNYNFLINIMKILKIRLKDSMIGFADTFSTHFHSKLFKIG